MVALYFGHDQLPIYFFYIQLKYSLYWYQIHDWSQLDRITIFDVFVKKVGIRIETDVNYKKQTDNKQYLTFNSCHHQTHYSLARKLRMIISEDQSLTQRMSELKDVPLKQKYPQSIIESGIQRAMNLEKSKSRPVRYRSQENVVIFVSTFKPKHPELLKSYDKIL